MPEAPEARELVSWAVFWRGLAANVQANADAFKSEVGTGALPLAQFCQAVAELDGADDPAGLDAAVLMIGDASLSVALGVVLTSWHLARGDEDSAVERGLRAVARRLLDEFRARGLEPQTPVLRT